ncbi:MAG: DNA-processing protein DprA, partial [Bacteroidota bacterium]
MTLLQYELASTLLPGIGSKLSKTLISYCGSADAVFTSTIQQIRKIPGIGEKTITAIHQHREEALRRSEQILQSCQKKGIEVLHYTHERYPSRLKQISDAPAILFCRGNSALKYPKSVAIVGTRKATDYGKRITEEIVEQLKPHNPVIISGLAYGIDIAAHKAALTQGLPTIGILAGGLDKIYPAVHKDIAHKMQQEGALISENKP